MENLKNIAVIYGGSSSEREISLQSGSGIYEAVRALGHESSLIDFNDLTDLTELKNNDLIFIALHGFEGEGGGLQKKLDELNIPFTGSRYPACVNTWNKRKSKEILKANNINTPKWLEISEFSKDILQNGLQDKSFDKFKPFNTIFLKPEEDGSSVDIFKITNDEDLKKSYESCTNRKRGFLFEEYVEGKEFTVTIINNKCLPAIEIVTDNEFYDYDAKYISNETDLVETMLSDVALNEINDISLNAYNALGCSGCARVDLLQDREGVFYVIEINTVPGMTPHSCVPKSGSFIGLSYKDIVKKIIDASA
ncbi:D-alanine--D-alanine ligase [Gammaproteobacteria bacterium]|nr:D-alanine--D-alanine ligase [Gammaproteobacteria bacterium]MDA7844831.1 D-alanine--D-alanine ligase [Gammaproteobacteria bacterium]MDA8955777.1 D-alanine--D-alanine ligase [Gammaproteobacteria bacterium]